MFCVAHHSFHRARKSASASPGDMCMGIVAPSTTSAGSGQLAWMLGSSWVAHHSFQILSNSAGWGLGVGVGGGSGVGVAVGGGVGVGSGVGVGVGVAVGLGVGVGVAVGTGVAVGMGVGVFVGAGVGVGSGVGTGVAVGSLGHPANARSAIKNGMRTRTLGLASQDCTIQLPLRNAFPRGADSKDMRRRWERSDSNKSIMALSMCLDNVFGSRQWAGAT